MEAKFVRILALHRLAAWWMLAASLAVAAEAPLVVDEAQGKKAAIEKPAPAYPLAARQLKISGDVHVEAVVRPDGVVEDVRIVTGNPVLTKPAVEAVKKWRSPTRHWVNGTGTVMIISIGVAD